MTKYQECMATLEASRTLGTIRAIDAYISNSLHLRTVDPALFRQDL